MKYSTKYSDKWKNNSGLSIHFATSYWEVTKYFSHMNSEVEHNLIPELNFICFLNLAKLSIR